MQALKSKQQYVRLNGMELCEQLSPLEIELLDILADVIVYVELQKRELEGENKDDTE